MNIFKKLTVAAAASALALLAIPASADTRIALVVKSLGNGFFDAAAKGADEAAAATVSFLNIFISIPPDALLSIRSSVCQILYDLGPFLSLVRKHSHWR